MFFKSNEFIAPPEPVKYENVLELGPAYLLGGFTLPLFCGQHVVHMESPLVQCSSQYLTFDANGWMIESKNNYGNSWGNSSDWHDDFIVAQEGSFCDKLGDTSKNEDIKQLANLLTTYGFTVKFDNNKMTFHTDLPNIALHMDKLPHRCGAYFSVLNFNKSPAFHELFNPIKENDLSSTTRPN